MNARLPHHIRSRLGSLATGVLLAACSQQPPAPPAPAPSAHTLPRLRIRPGLEHPGEQLVLDHKGRAFTRSICNTPAPLPRITYRGLANTHRGKADLSSPIPGIKPHGHYQVFTHWESMDYFCEDYPLGVGPAPSDAVGPYLLATFPTEARGRVYYIFPSISARRPHKSILITPKSH